MNTEIEASGHTTPDGDKKRSGSTPSVPEKIEQVENAGSSLAVDAETEKRLLKKLDRRIIPMICWIYLMNFMDRGRCSTFGEDCLQLTMKLTLVMPASTVWRKTLVCQSIVTNINWLLVFCSLRIV